MSNWFDTANILSIAQECQVNMNGHVSWEIPIIINIKYNIHRYVVCLITSSESKDNRREFFRNGVIILPRFVEWGKQRNFYKTEKVIVNMVGVSGSLSGRLDTRFQCRCISYCLAYVARACPINAHQLFLHRS